MLNLPEEAAANRSAVEQPAFSIRLDAAHRGLSTAVAADPVLGSVNRRVRADWRRTTEPEVHRVSSCLLLLHELRAQQANRRLDRIELDRWSPDRLAPPRPAGTILVHGAFEDGRLRTFEPGDLVTACSLVLPDRTGRVEQASITGNIFDLLRRSAPLGGSVSSLAGSSTFYGCTDSFGLEVHQ